MSVYIYIYVFVMLLKHTYIYIYMCGLFVYQVEHNPRPLGSIDQFNNYAGFTWTMCTTFNVCFKFSNFISFRKKLVHKNQEIGKMSKISSVWIEC